MNLEKSVILGLHGDECGILSLQDRLEMRGYQVDVARTPVEMRSKCAQRTYQAYIMNVNLGYPEGYDFSVAKEIYASIEPEVKSGEIGFYAYSASLQVVEEAKRQGIPAIWRPDFDGKFELIFGEIKPKQ